MSAGLQIPKTNGVNGHKESSSAASSPQSPFKNGFSKIRHANNDMEEL